MKNMESESDNSTPLLNLILKTHVFNVPDTYFENSYNQILNNVFIDSLKEKNEESGLIIPENYFNNLKKDIENGVFSIKSKETFKNESFKTPENYFTNAAIKILNKSEEDQQITPFKIIKFNVIRYAAAACVLLICSLGVYFEYQKKQNISYQLSKIPEAEIVNYLLQNADANDMPLIIENLDNSSVFPVKNEKLTDKEIEEYLENTSL